MSFLSLATLQTWTTRKYRQSSLWRLAEKWHEGSTSVIRLCNSSSFDERNPSRFCHTNWQQRDKSVKRIYLKEWGKNEDNRCLMMRLKHALIIMAIQFSFFISIMAIQYIEELGWIIRKTNVHVNFFGKILVSQRGKPTSLYQLTMVPFILLTHVTIR